MYRRYKPKRKNTSQVLPIVAVSLTLVGLLTWGYFAKGDDIASAFEVETIVVTDDTEANKNLSDLMADLSGDRKTLLKLAEDRKRRLGWIRSEEARGRVLWFLVNRLLDEGEWQTARPLVKELSSNMIPVEGLDRIAEVFYRQGEYDDQLKLEFILQERLLTGTEDKMPVLLRSLSRYVETCALMDKKNEAYEVLNVLRRDQVRARLKKNPEVVVNAATLMLRCIEVSGAQSTENDEVRVLLQQAEWPACPSTGKLLLSDAVKNLRNPNASPDQLTKIKQSLLKSLGSLLRFPDNDSRLYECYSALGKVCFRLKDYDACVQYLTLSDAFARGYGINENKLKELELEHCRLRARANEARGALDEAIIDYRHLLAAETELLQTGKAKPADVFTCLSFLAEHTEGEEKIELLKRSWTMLHENESLLKDSKLSYADIAAYIADYYVGKEEYSEAINWVKESVTIQESAYPDLSAPNLADGKVLRARMRLALIERKTEKHDAAASERLKLIVRAIEQMDDDTRAKLNEADPGLYKEAVREFSRTYLLMGGKYNERLARQVIRKIKESLPAKTR